MDTKVLPLYGLMAEFSQVEEIIAAAEKTRLAGYKIFDAYTPFPVHGLAEAIGFKKTKVPLICACGAIMGGSTGFLMQWYANVMSYPMITGAKPLNCWPAFIPITFELSVLGAAFGAVLGMLALNGLPEPYHPVFNVPAFQLASRDKFFLCIESRDLQFDLEKTRQFLE